MSAFVLCLVNLGCHKNVAEKIWGKYLNPFDRWMIIASKKYKTDKDFFESLKRKINFVNEVALNGYLDILRWASRNGAPWNEWTCANAAQNGHLDVLMWIKQKWMSLGCMDLCICSLWRPFRHPTMASLWR